MKYTTQIKLALSKRINTHEYWTVPILKAARCTIASYPRSGNTYARLLLAKYIFNVDCNEKEIDRYIIDPYQTKFRDIKRMIDNDTAYIKWHAYPVGLEHNSIYIKRDPIDVFYSLYSYLKYRVKLIDDSPSVYFNKFTSIGYGTFGNVLEHQRLWCTHQNAHGKLIIEFKDLINSVGTAQKMIEAATGKPANESKLKDSVNALKLSKLKIKETKTFSSSFFGSKEGHEELLKYETLVREWENEFNR